MNWNCVIEYSFPRGGFQIYPYQLAAGVSIKYLSCLRSFLFRFYLGPFKLWFNIGGEDEKRKLPKFKDIIGLYAEQEKPTIRGAKCGHM